MRTLWVMARQDDALDRQVQFSGLCYDRCKVRFVGVGASLCGEGYDEIILDDIYAEANKRQSVVHGEIINKWVRENLPCRLYPGGKIRILSDQE